MEASFNASLGTLIACCASASVLSFQSTSALFLGLGLLATLPITVVLAWKNSFRQQFALGVHAFIILTVLDRTRKNTLEREPLDIAILTFPGISLGGLVGVACFALTPFNATADSQTKSHLQIAGKSLGHALRASASLFDVEAMAQATGRQLRQVDGLQDTDAPSGTSATCSHREPTYNPPDAASAPNSKKASGQEETLQRPLCDDTLLKAVSSKRNPARSFAANLQQATDSTVADARIATKPLLRFVRNKQIEAARKHISAASAALKQTFWELPNAAQWLCAKFKTCSRLIKAAGGCRQCSCSCTRNKSSIVEQKAICFETDLYTTEKKWMYVLAQLKYMSYLTQTATESIAGSRSHFTSVGVLAPHLIRVARLAAEVLTASMAFEMAQSGKISALLCRRQRSIERIWHEIGSASIGTSMKGADASTDEINSVQRVGRLRRKLEGECGLLMRQFALIQPTLAHTGSGGQRQQNSEETSRKEKNTDLMALSSIVFGSMRSAQLTLRAAFMPGGVGSSLDPEQVLPSLRPADDNQHCTDGDDSDQDNINSPPAEFSGDEVQPEECGPSASQSASSSVSDEHLRQNEPVESTNCQRTGTDTVRRSNGVGLHTLTSHPQRQMAGNCSAGCSCSCPSVPTCVRTACAQTILSSFAWQRALKLTLAVMAASLLLILDSGMDFAVLAPLAVGFAAGANAGNTFATGYRRLAGTVLGSLAGFFVVELSFNTPLPLILLLSLSTGTINVLNFLADNEGQAIAIITGFTVMLVTLFVDVSQPIAETGNLALARIEQNVIGVSLLLLISAVVFPYRKLDEVPKHVSRGLQDLEVACQQTFELLHVTLGAGSQSLALKSPENRELSEAALAGAPPRSRPIGSDSKRPDQPGSLLGSVQMDLTSTGVQRALSSPPDVGEQQYAESAKCSTSTTVNKPAAMVRREVVLLRAFYLRMYYTGIPLQNVRVQLMLDDLDGEVEDANREALFERRLFPKERYLEMAEAMHNFVQHLRQINQIRMTLALQSAHYHHSRVLVETESQGGMPEGHHAASNQSSQDEQELEFSTLSSACRELLHKLDQWGCLGVTAALGIERGQVLASSSHPSSSTQRMSMKDVVEKRHGIFASVLPNVEELFETLSECCRLLADVMDSSRREVVDNRQAGQPQHQQAQDEHEAAWQLKQLAAAGSALQRIQTQTQRSIASANAQAAEQLSHWLAHVASSQLNAGIRGQLFGHYSGRDPVQPTKHSSAEDGSGVHCRRQAYSASYASALQQPAPPRTMLMHSMLRANAEAVYFSSLGLELQLLGDCMQRILLHGSDAFVQTGKVDYSSRLLQPLQNHGQFSLPIRSSTETGAPHKRCVPTVMQACVARAETKRQLRPPPPAEVLRAVEGTSQPIHAAALMKAAESS